MIYAGFWKRAAACVIDFTIGLMLFLVLPIVAVTMWEPHLIDRFSKSLDEDVIIMAFYLLSMLLNWLYSAWFMASKWQGTPGMRVVDIQIVNYANERITFLRATLHHFASWISSSIFLIGYLMIAFTPRKQGLHDFIAKTLVVRKP